MDVTKFCVGKRGEALYKTDKGLKDFYKYYKKKYSFTSDASKFAPSKASLIVDEGTYNKILKDYFKMLGQELLNNPEGISIRPLGVLRIRKNKMHFKALMEKEKLRIDWRASKEAGKVVYHTNDHRNNHYYNVSWLKNVNYIFLPLYAFSANRLNIKRKIKTVLKNPLKDFYSKRIY